MTDISASEVLKFFNSIDPMTMFEGEPIKGQTYKADGWVYRDIKKCSPEAFSELVKIIGAENMACLIRSAARDGSWVRGQYLVSPEGMRRAIEWKRPEGSSQ